MVDRICHLYYGDAANNTERVLELNQNVSGKSLAEWGAVLPEGLVIELPELEPLPSSGSGTQLWD